MPGERSNKKTPSRTEIADRGPLQLEAAQREHIYAALALLLGPETDYHARVRAARRLTKHGPAILPMLLSILSNYPEITTPAWPEWPPQYEHCSYLLVRLAQQAQMSLEELLRFPSDIQSAGPVLWTSIIEATGLLLEEDHEALLCEALTTPWMTVRYAAAMALAARAGRVQLQRQTVDRLHACLKNDEDFPVRLTAACALLNSGDYTGLEVLAQLMEPPVPDEVRKAATFVLAAEPIPLSTSQRERLAVHLINLLQDSNTELALQAAHALSTIAPPSTLPALYELLADLDPQRLVAVLAALEEMAGRDALRSIMRRHSLPSRIAPLLRSELPAIRRQASYSLASCGGTYARAVLGTIVHNRDHPAHIEAVEGLRALHGVLRAPTRTNVVGWLLYILSQPVEEARVIALDSLAHLLFQARTQRKMLAWQQISLAIMQDGLLLGLLSNSSSWVRQQAVELIGMLWSHTPHLDEAYDRVLHLLRTDGDSGVRACAAFVCGQAAVRNAIPGLIEALLDSDEYVAETAFHSLCRLATSDDVIIVHVIKELARYSDPHSHHPHRLAQPARACLRKWRKRRHAAKAE